MKEIIKEKNEFDLENNNTRKLIYMMRKRKLITTSDPSNFNEKDKEFVRFIINLVHDREIMRKLLNRYDKKTRVELILTCEMNKIERYIFMSYFNHFRKVELAKQTKEKVKSLPITAVFNNIFTYFKNARFQYHDFKTLYETIRKMKAKARYYAKNKEIDNFLSNIKTRKKGE